MKFFNDRKSMLGAAFLASTLIFATSCGDDDDMGMDDDGPTGPNKTTYTQEDQMGRPAINTVLVTMGNKNEFNTTIPSDMEAEFQADFAARVAALNPDFDSTALGDDATELSTLLSNDVLGVATNGKTTFADLTDGTILTGRKLTDDVVDTELLLIFGGSDGMQKPGLVSDNVDENDKLFLSTFPYLSSPH